MDLEPEQNLPLLHEDEEKNVVIKRETASLYRRSAIYVLSAYSVLTTIVILYLQAQTCKFSTAPYCT